MNLFLNSLKLASTQQTVLECKRPVIFGIFGKSAKIFAQDFDSELKEAEFKFGI